ncbi:MAG: glycosyltransferase family 4 protein [Planctomycetota bacterium]
MSASNLEPRVAMISSYVPRRCGIATFCNNLADALAQRVTGTGLSSDSNVGVIALNDQAGGYNYPSEVMLQIEQHRRDAYRDAGEIINTSRAQAVSIQHEFGLFGGEAGEYLLDLVDQLRKPIVPTLHTILTNPSDKQRFVLTQLCASSQRIVVMADRARRILNEIYGVPLDKIKLIHHGVPDLPLGNTEPFKERFEVAGRPVILTFGLLSPGKTIEVMLDALARIVPKHPKVAYIVLGVTHPGVRRESGEQYRLGLQSQAVQLGIQRNVFFHNHYVSNDDLGEYLQAADIYVTPYRAKEQITSGTLAYALAAGKPIVSTPYWHAEELLAEGRGRMFDFGNSEQLAQHLDQLLSDRELRAEVSKSAYDYGRQMTWPRVAETYVSAIDEARQLHVKTSSTSCERRRIMMRVSLPEPRLDHLYRLSDDTGMLQHAAMATPDRAHGYCTDDNARALLVATMAYGMFRDEEVMRYLNVYLSFLHYSMPPGGGRFRNFMSYDRRWFDQDGSDDCQGRSLWALGYVVAHAPDEATRQLSADLFRAGLVQVDSMIAPRSWALSILGLHHYLREFGADGERRPVLGVLADRLEQAFADNARDDWPWFENVVTYDNGRLPQAMIVSGFTLNRKPLVERGLKTLDWLLRIQRSDDGHLSVIGNDGWMRSEGSRAQFDQQPLEAAALIAACKAAYRATQDRKWLEEMRRCFEWYIGFNDVGVPLIDFKTRGCCDGLHKSGLNRNQGAESTLSWLLSLLIMHQMQTGDPPEVG